MHATPRSRRQNHRSTKRASDRSADGDSGFTLIELLVTVVIVGILAAVAAPMMTGDRKESDVRGFTGSLAKDLQRSKNEAVAERLPVHAYFFSDRVEFRIARPGVALGDPPILPLATDPVIRVLQAKNGVEILDVTTTNTAPSGPVLTTATMVEVQFTTLGGIQVVGQPQWTPAFIWIRNSTLPANHPFRNARIDVTALTGYVQLREGR